MKVTTDNTYKTDGLKQNILERAGEKDGLPEVRVLGK
jgi:hypothetical protein